MTVAQALRRVRGQVSPARGLALAHHAVAERGGRREFELVPALPVSEFEERLDLLVERYRVVPARELLETAARRRRGDPVPVSLTFDDDLRSHLDVVAPRLLSRGLPATFFVNPPLPAGEAFWWEDLQALADTGRLPSRLESLPELDLEPLRGRVARAIHEGGRTVESLPPDRRDAVAAELHTLAGSSTRPRLDAEAMSELASAGFELGFHTKRHYVLTTLGSGLLERELRDGHGVVERIARHPVTTLAYPHGKADARIARAAESAGFSFAFAGRKSPVDRRTDPFLVPRIEVHAAPLDEFEGRLSWVLSGPAA
jgi:peptidoglycan/xylan/chitin deacetylase (PgdA/CDA1 family)